ncbi:hypothetical protein EXIGLDRAFT_723940 [Exidia glandulosa HHB12029]|uniref:Glycan binding protein Y3-like domain-containing protein n=1 Tax=Exidia glandulosa HHB12029 TaxID=1314781 RepID=A0A165EM47_EXIGL|nr:hypothetical protein EXIGLDRAFT_723940 [Exidia glandulosa HHB12029]
MHLIPALSAVLVAATTVVAQGIKCNLDGPGPGVCQNFINDFCTDMSNFPWSGLQSGSMCFNTGAAKCFMTVWESVPGDPPQKFNVGNCITTLQQVSKSCPTGAGNGTVGGPFTWFISGAKGSSCMPI